MDTFQKDRRNQAEYRKRKAQSDSYRRPRGRPRLEEKYPELMAAIKEVCDSTDVTTSVPKIQAHLQRITDFPIKRSTLYTRLQST